MRGPRDRILANIDAAPTDAAAQKRLLDAIARQDFGAFTHRCFTSLSPGARFEPNWHIDALAYHLEQVRTGKIRRLIVNMPPRSLKSIVALGRLPGLCARP